MASEQEQSFCIKKTSLLEDSVLDRICAPVLNTAVEKSPPQPAISDILSYGLKDLKIELPQINIPNVVIFKCEIERYMKLFKCKEKPARTSVRDNLNGSYLNCSEIGASQCKTEVHNEEGLKTSVKILNFSCTKCRNNIRYSPNDLQKHFQQLHHGELPSYPCEMCNFSANDFQSFNQHRRTHRSTLVKCEICNDEQRYTLLDLTKHFTSMHCINGHFQCERCRFSTQDVGTFVQHIHRHNEMQYKCDQCNHVSFSIEEFQKHVVSHTGSFPFSCQYCNYMASRKNYLIKHIITLHRDRLYPKDKLDANNTEKNLKTSAGLKLILKRYKIGASRKALWRRKKVTSGNGRIGEEDGQVPTIMNAIQPKYEEPDQSAKKQQLNEDPAVLNDKHVHSEVKSTTTVQSNKAEDGSGSGPGLLQKAVHGPTVLMVKNNKISVPANYSAKFMGFKVVDGKQHIVIKLLPMDKQNLPVGNKVDGVRDGSTECLQHSSDNFNLPLSAGPHETSQQTSKSNPVHSLTSSALSLSNQYLRKIKQENTNYFSGNISQTVTSPVAVVRKGATLLQVKPDSATLPCDLVVNAGNRGTASWRNCIPQDRPQVLSSAGSRTLHYDPMKKTFPSEFKVLNGEVNNSSPHNSVYCPSGDSSSQRSLPFHNYSKTSKTFPLQRSFAGETTSRFSQSALNLEKRSSLPHLYGYLNSSTTSVVSSNQPNYATERQSFTENHSNQCLITNVNHMFSHVEDPKQEIEEEPVANCVNLSLMPKITSVFSLQSKQASNYLTPEVNQSLQGVLQPTTQPQTYLKTECDQSFPNDQMDCKMFRPVKDSAVLCRLTPSAKVKRELNMNCNTTNENGYFRNEKASMRSFRTEERNPASRVSGVGALLKTQTDNIITQQLAKDKMKYSIQAPNAICPFGPEQKKPVVLQTTEPQFFVPLRLAHQQGLQVISEKSSPKMGLTEAQATRGVPTSLLLNKGPGMILTFGSGSLGTIANVSENSSQVLEKCPSKEHGREAISPAETELKIGNVRSSFGGNECSREVSISSIGMPQKEQLPLINSESRISSVKILAEYQDSKISPLESNKQQEMGQEQPVYALLPDGRQAVFLKCMSPNKSLIQNHNIFQGTTYSPNFEPKKPGVMQQKLFLKIKSFPAAANCQPVSNVVSSLPSNSMHSLYNTALEQKKTAVSSSDALFLPYGLMPANACLVSDKSEDSYISVDSVHSSKHVKTRSQKISSDLAPIITVNKRSSFDSQTSTPTTTNKISRAKRHSKPTGAKFFNAAASQKNRNLKRKMGDLQEPPRKKMLQRKCKQKTQMDGTELESLIQGPSRMKMSKDTVRTLKLLPFNSKQLVKCPRRNQPVVVLNHPDADVPEVVNVMKTIAKFKGHVLKVSLSKRTIDALLDPEHHNNSLYIISSDLSQRKCRMLKPVSPVKERFVLKLTLKKTSKNNYQIVKTTSDNTLKTKFSCWFCGRIFDNQDNWVGHGQRHLMEATRDWNSIG